MSKGEVQELLNEKELNYNKITIALRKYVELYMKTQQISSERLEVILTMLEAYKHLGLELKKKIISKETIQSISNLIINKLSEL